MAGGGGNPLLSIRVMGSDNPPPGVFAVRIVVLEILVLCGGRIARLVRRRRRRVLKSIAKDIGPNAAFGYPYTKQIVGGVDVEIVVIKESCAIRETAEPKE